MPIPLIKRAQPIADDFATAAGAIKDDWRFPGPSSAMPY